MGAWRLCIGYWGAMCSDALHDERFVTWGREIIAHMSMIMKTLQLWHQKQHAILIYGASTTDESLGRVG